MWSEKMLDTISIFLDLLRFVLWLKMCCILENVPCAPEKMYSSAFGWNILKISMRSISSNVSLKTCVSHVYYHVWNESPVQVHRVTRCAILDAWGWCTGTTQRHGMGREEGGGFRMGNTCIPVAESFDIWQNQYNIVKFKNKIKLKKKDLCFRINFLFWWSVPWCDWGVKVSYYYCVTVNFCFYVC